MKHKNPLHPPQAAEAPSMPFSDSTSARRVGVRFPAIAAMLGFPQGLNTHECYDLGRTLMSLETRSKAEAALHPTSDEEIAQLLLLLSAEFEDDFADLPSSTKFNSLDASFLSHFWTRKLKEWRSRESGTHGCAPSPFEPLLKRFEKLQISKRVAHTKP